MWMVISLMVVVAGIVVWRWYARSKHRKPYNEFRRPIASVTSATLMASDPGGAAGIGGGFDAGGCGGDGGGGGGAC